MSQENKRKGDLPLLGATGTWEGTLLPQPDSTASGLVLEFPYLLTFRLGGSLGPFIWLVGPSLQNAISW